MLGLEELMNIHWTICNNTVDGKIPILSKSSWQVEFLESHRSGKGNEVPIIRRK